MLRVLPAIISLVAAMQSAQLQTLSLKRFEVIRIETSGIQRLPDGVRDIFTGPVSGLARPVRNLEEAARQVGFTPRLPASPMPQEVLVMSPVNNQPKIAAADLQNELRRADVDVPVPQDWDGVTLAIQQGAGLLADYGDYFIAEAPPMTLSAPAGFRMDQFIEVLFRLAGLNSADATKLRQKFMAGPALYFPIAPKYDMDIREVQLTTGTGLLLQNAEKGAELAFMWSTADRSYFLSGFLTEAAAIALANSIK